MILHTAPIHIEGISGVISDTVVPVEEYCAGLLSPKRLKRMVQSTGFESLSIASPDVCASDLCYQAACQLFNEGGVTKDSIGGLIFVSQTHDYLLPGTAYVLQKRLGLGNDIIAMDVSMGCPGFVYGLYLASSMMSSLRGKKVMILCGDARIRKSKPDSTLFGAIDGDGGACAVVGAGQEGETLFNIRSYGERYESLFMERGGSRWLKSQADRDSMDTVDWTRDISMDGMGILDFSLHEVVENIEELLQEAHCLKEEIGAFLCHQPQKILLQGMADKLGVDNLIFNSQHIGNSSCASIPLVLTEMKRQGQELKNKKVLMSGFGVGLSVASTILDLSDLMCVETKRYERNHI